ncbi:hypothetical protein PMAYCL1PPCAC_12553, partial [Pristionchus mayeri]
ESSALLSNLCSSSHRLCASLSFSMRELLTRAFSAAVAAANPLECVRRSLRFTPSCVSVIGSSVWIPLEDSTPLYLISFGKGAAAMAEGAEQILGSRIKEGIVILPNQQGISHTLRSRVYEAGASNLPDRRSIEATKEVLSLVDGAECDAVFLVLISGGGSALLSLPSKGVNLDQKVTTIRALVAKGASIQQLNGVRRVLSQVKGGGLADRMGERKSLSLILSDIVGDPLEFIASGPTVHPQSSIRAASVIDDLKARSSLPKEVIDAIERENMSLRVAPSAAHHVIIGNNAMAMEEAKKFLDTERFRSTIATCTRVGEAEELGREVADTVVSLQRGERTAILYGGETTANLPAKSGMGGRNQHAALTAMIHLSRRREEWKGLQFSLLFAGTDGQDGPSDAAGATVTSQQIIDLTPQEIELAEKAFVQANSYNFWKEFRGGECHFKPGLTGTNVMDITIILSHTM